MLSVIIPALNEEKTIGAVVRFCFSEPGVSEVIVVDDRSEDATVAVAKDAGAKIIISAARGKGISMKEGIQEATNEFAICKFPMPKSIKHTHINTITYDDDKVITLNSFKEN